MVTVLLFSHEKFHLIVDSALVSLHTIEVGSVSDISVSRVASVFRVK